MSTWHARWRAKQQEEEEARIQNEATEVDDHNEEQVEIEQDNEPDSEEEEQYEESSEESDEDIGPQECDKYEEPEEVVHQNGEEDEG